VIELIDDVEDLLRECFAAHRCREAAADAQVIGDALVDVDQ